MRVSRVILYKGISYIELVQGAKYIQFTSLSGFVILQENERRGRDSQIEK